MPGTSISSRRRRPGSAPAVATLARSLVTPYTGQSRLAAAAATAVAGTAALTGTSAGAGLDPHPASAAQVAAARTIRRIP